jgi:hypothetical protein
MSASARGATLCRKSPRRRVGSRVVVGCWHAQGLAVVMITWLPVFKAGLKEIKAMLPLVVRWTR